MKGLNLIGLTADDLARALSGDVAMKKPEKVADGVEARVLLDMLGDVVRRTPFEVGDLIRQKQSYDAYSFGTRLCIVTHVFDKPMLEPSTKTSADFRNDIVILVRNGDQHHPQEYPVQSWRFERYDGPVEPA